MMANKMNRFFQEKLETIQREPGWEYSPKLNQWESFESQRIVRQPKEDDSLGSYGDAFNYLPPGQAIDDNATEFGPTVLAGTTDVTTLVDTEGLRCGFTDSPMSPTDDIYSGEHVDAFYGEVYSDEGEIGFVERNNYLDRL
jgi:hypothetical protein